MRDDIGISKAVVQGQGDAQGCESSEGSHSPIPWHFNGGYEIYDDRGGAITVLDSKGERTSEEDRANGRFVCRAVNAHDALVEALSRLSDYLRSSGFNGLYVDRAEAALSFAKGGNGKSVTQKITGWHFEGNNHEDMYVAKLVCGHERRDLSGVSPRPLSAVCWDCSRAMGVGQ